MYNPRTIPCQSRIYNPRTIVPANPPAPPINHPQCTALSRGNILQLTPTCPTTASARPPPPKPARVPTALVHLLDAVAGSPSGKAVRRRFATGAVADAFRESGAELVLIGRPLGLHDRGPSRGVGRRRTTRDREVEPSRHATVGARVLALRQDATRGRRCTVLRRRRARGGSRSLQQNRGGGVAQRLGEADGRACLHRPGGQPRARHAALREAHSGVQRPSVSLDVEVDELAAREDAGGQKRGRDTEAWHHGSAEVHVVDAKRCIASSTHDMRELRKLASHRLTPRLCHRGRLQGSSLCFHLRRRPSSAGTCKRKACVSNPPKLQLGAVCQTCACTLQTCECSSPECRAGGLLGWLPGTRHAVERPPFPPQHPHVADSPRHLPGASGRASTVADTRLQG